MLYLEDIKIGDFVPCFDDNGNIYHRPVTRLFKNPAPDNLVEINVNDKK